MSEPPDESTKRAQDAPNGAAGATGTNGDEAESDAPLGAIAVTGFLAAVILVMWFAMYALNLARS